MKTKIALIFILLTAAFFRFYGLNWDQNHHLHPDERFLTMVASALSWPDSIGQYLNTGLSPLNPHNRGYGYFVYGTYPVHLVKAIAEWLQKGNYGQLVLVGRFISATVDVMIVLLVYLITLHLTSKKSSGLWAAFFYAASVLPIQLAHYFTVDPYLTFFLTLTLYLLVANYNRQRSLIYFAAAASYGLSIAAKISALYIAPAILAFMAIALTKSFHKIRLAVTGFISIIICFVVIRLSYPYLFSATGLIPAGLNPEVLGDWRELDNYYSWDSYKDKSAWVFPPAVLFLSAKPYWTPFINVFVWGLGLPLGLFLLIGLLSAVKKIITAKKLVPDSPLFIPVLWILVLFGIQGGQFLLYMRYFYPIIPPLCVLGGIFIQSLLSTRTILLKALTVALVLIWPISFMAIYFRPHSRVSASHWIYEHIPPGSKISFEHWDDPLPLNIGNFTSSVYTFVELPLYEPDTPAKWTKIKTSLSQIDYLILSSNRLYGSITGVPDRYPQTSHFYKNLFSGKTEFKLVAQFTSRPTLPFPGIRLCLTPPWDSYGKIAMPLQECSERGLVFVDDYADETFTVYDHPKVLIFKKDVN